MSSPPVPLDFPEIDCLIDDIPRSLPKNRISTSVDNIRSLTSFPPKRVHRNSCQINAFEPPRRKSITSTRKCSVSSTRRHRTSSTGTARKWMSQEQKAIEKKRRRTVCVVVGMFLFILFSCVLVVIVTLTHQTEMGRRNHTMVYYTFAPPSDSSEAAQSATTTAADVRKENEELMNSLVEDSTSHDSLQNLTASVPVSLK